MSDDERWETVAWEMLDLTTLIAVLEPGPRARWPDDLEKLLRRIEPGRTVEEHVDAVGQGLAEAARGPTSSPSYVGLAWWIYAELRDFPTDAQGHDRAVSLANQWQAFGTVSITS